MRKKSQAARFSGNAEMITEVLPESIMIASERPEGTNPSLKKIKSSLANQGSSNRKVRNFSVRRSERIQNSTPRNLKIQTVIEEITLSESDEEDELPADHEKNLPPPDQETDWPEFMMGGNKFEGKIDYIVKLLERHGHTLDSIKTEVSNGSFSTDTVPTPDAKYKSLYIASEKKNEELAEENRVLTQKLENALDRFEAYKNGNRVAFEMMEKLKDFILISNGFRVSDSTQATSEEELGKVMSLNADDARRKRKKLAKQN